MADKDFKFPDETEENKVEIQIEGEGEIDLEIVDDTPDEDKGRKPLDKEPEDVTDDEVAEYSEKVKKRIKELSHARHDERRAKETERREKEEALRLAQQVIEENKQLRAAQAAGRTENAALAKAAAEAALDLARKKFRAAQEEMDNDALLAAQEEITEAKIKLSRINDAPAPQKQEGGQREEREVYTQPTPSAVPRPDDKAVRWLQQNPWYGQDDEMTSFALGVHRKLVNEGVDPRTDEYYGRLNARLREVFPTNFEGEQKPERKPATVVAPATRSTGPKKVRLTKTQVALANKLGLTLEAYAKQVAKEQESSNV